MKNIALRLRYDGSLYHGWQIQKNEISVAQTVEEALEKLKQSTRRYAKRQLTWFGTDQRMRWIEPDTLAAGETPLDKALEILDMEGLA